MGFITTLLWRLKWALVLAIVLGPALAYFSYQDMQRVERIMAHGTIIDAVVTGGRQQSGRYSSTYYLDLGWQDQQGAHTQEVKIGYDYAQQVISGNEVMIGTAPVRYLASEPDEPVVVIADAASQQRINQETIWIGLIAGLAGLIFAPIWFWMDHRRARATKATTQDIDTMLAQMRANNTSQQTQQRT